MQPSPFQRSTKQPLDISRNIPQSRSSSAWATQPREPTSTTTNSSSAIPSHPFPSRQQKKDELIEAAHYKKSSAGRTMVGEGTDMSMGRGTDEQHQRAVNTNKEFERLMDELQIPTSVRLKVSPLDTPMKESLLISFRAQAASQRPHPSVSPNRPGHTRAQSSHPSQMHGPGSGSPVKRGMEQVGAVGMGFPMTPDPKAGRHVRKAQSSSTLRSPSGSNMYQSASQPIPSHSGRSSPETRTIDNSKFVMLSTARSPSKSSSSFFGKSTPAPPPMTKRYTIDGLQLPPCLPGDEDLYASQSNTSGESGSKGGSSKTKTKSRGRGFSFGAGNASANSNSNADGGPSGKRSSWFGSRSRDASSNGHIDAITFPGSSSGTGSISDTGHHINEKHTRTRPRAKSRASQDLSATAGGSTGSGVSSSKKWSPAQWAGWLKLEDTFKMGVERAKTLRMLLRHESTEWVEAFLMAGGYEFILRKLDDLLKVEWRTEQHDDKLLYELLRCVKALSTLEVGKQALVAHGSSPFRQLADLLYSEKKPGDLATRQVILELFHSVLSLRPSISALSATSPTGSMGPPSLSHTSSSSNTSEQSTPALRNRSSYINMKAVKPEDTSARGTAVVLDLLRSTEDSVSKSKAEDKRGGLPFLEPASELPAPKLEMHDFLTRVHTEKPYKTYLRELSDVCRDYYWIMCHGENNIWLLSDVDKRSIKPQAPSGATGGVEFEAVFYMTSHFRLLNSLARALAQQDMLDPDVRADRKRGESWKLHTEMFASGMDRILATIRKASVDFYTEFHLELAIYIQLARESGVRLPYVIEKLLGPPAEKFRKFDAFPGDPSGGMPSAQQPRQWLPPPRSSSGFDVRAC